MKIRNGWQLAFAALLASPLVAAPPTAESNAQIGDDTNVAHAVVDREKDNGMLFSALLRQDGSIRVLYSADAGASWTSATTFSGAQSVDAAVAGIHLYVGYASGSTAMLRRFSSATGSPDGAYGGAGTHGIVDVSPAVVEEVALASNSADDDDTLWVIVLASDGVVRAYYDEAADGTTFSLSGSSFAAGDSGLSASWNVGYPEDSPEGMDITFSYVGTNDTVYVYRRKVGVAWYGSAHPSETAAEETSLSAYRDHLVLAYEHADPSGDQDAAFRISQDCGGGWSAQSLWADLEGGDFSNPLVDVRSGTGIAAALKQETGADDPIGFRERLGYTTPTWQPSVRLNDEDAVTEDSYRTDDFDWLGSGWGLTYVDGSGRAWFAWSKSIRYSGFESGDLDEWSAAVGGP